MSKYTDLKLIDELLCDIKMETNLSWSELEDKYTSTTRYAINRLRQAWKNKEMDLITLSLSNYFDNIG